jgi:hypothetical protein
MAFTRLTREIPITPSGGTFTIDVDSPEVEYTVTGIATMIATVDITPTSAGVIPNNTKVIINYLATLDTTVTTFYVFGASLNPQQTLRDQQIICTYVNSAWTVQILSNFANPDIVGTSNIVNGAVTNAKLATNSVSTIKIQDLAVTTNKIDNLAVTAGKIATDAVTTAKILDSNVTDAKLAAMTASSIKYGNASGIPGNLALGLNKIPVGNGTTVTVVDKNDLLNGVGTYTQISCEMSFEAGELNAYKRIYVPYPCLFIQAQVSVTTTIEATDDAFYEINNTFGGFTIMSGSIPAGTLPPASTSTIPSGSLGTYTPLSGIYSTIFIYTTKVTPGGRAFVTILLQKT